MRLVAPPSPSADLPLWPPLLSTRGVGARSGGHAHHAIHVVLAIEGTLAIDVENRRIEAAGVVTAPDVPHAIDAEGREILLVFLEPESRVGSVLAAAIDGPCRTIDEALRDRLIADPMAIMGEAGVAWCDRLIGVFGGPSMPRAIHPRVRRVIAHLRTDPEDVSLEALAEIAGLSPGRLMHAFTESIGIPIRPYLAWLRLQRAAAGIVGGRPLAEVAHQAGFADAAHMSRTFKQTFGMSPSALRPRS
jgi:AraC-like DNA-binding protein